MSLSPILFLHICAGITGVLSGFVAAFLRKGSRGHRMAGNAFFISMLALATSGAFMGLMKSQPTNFLAGILTSYLVATSWVTARRREKGTGVFDFGALLTALVVGAGYVAYGVAASHSQKGSVDGVPAAMLFVMASVALLAATGDVRMLLRGGISGTQRIARHLWRMCFSLFIASASVFLARAHLFPVFVRKTGALLLLSFLPLILMVFWLIRVRIGNTRKKEVAPYEGHVYSLRA